MASCSFLTCLDIALEGRSRCHAGHVATVFFAGGFSLDAVEERHPLQVLRVVDVQSTTGTKADGSQLSRGGRLLMCLNVKRLHLRNASEGLKTIRRVSVPKHSFSFPVLKLSFESS